VSSQILYLDHILDEVESHLDRWRDLGISLTTVSMSEMAFHEKTGRCQVGIGRNSLQTSG